MSETKKQPRQPVAHRDVYKRLGVIIDHYVALRGESYTTLAVKMKCSRSKISSKALAYNTSTLGDVVEIARALRVSPEQMMKGVW
jgi:hypothetical protein